MAFGIVPDTEWHLKDRIGIDRKKRLLNTPLEEIISRIVTTAEFCDLKPEPYKKGLDLKLKRISFRLRLPSQIVDLFHNGAGGYRAQYYLSVSDGENASRCVITEVQESLKKRRAELSDIQCSLEFIEASLCHHQAKIWIYEGRWLTDNASADRNLVVDRWEESANTKIWPYRFEASWVQLTPDSEALLDLKGGWINTALKHVDRGKEKCSSKFTS